MNKSRAIALTVAVTAAILGPLSSTAFADTDVTAPDTDVTAGRGGTEVTAPNTHVDAGPNGTRVTTPWGVYGTP